MLLGGCGNLCKTCSAIKNHFVRVVGDNGPMLVIREKPVWSILRDPVQHFRKFGLFLLKLG